MYNYTRTTTHDDPTAHLQDTNANAKMPKTKIKKLASVQHEKAKAAPTNVLVAAAAARTLARTNAAAKERSPPTASGHWGGGADLRPNHRRPRTAANITTPPRKTPTSTNLLRRCWGTIVSRWALEVDGQGIASMCLGQWTPGGLSWNP